MSRKKATSSKKRVTKKKSAPDYITVGDHLYERISKLSKEVELDLAQDVLEKIDRHISAGRYVSRGDAIRHILRTVIETKEGLE